MKFSRIRNPFHGAGMLALLLTILPLLASTAEPHRLGRKHHRLALLAIQSSVKDPVKFKEVVSTLKDVIEGIESAQTTAKDLSKSRKKECTATLKQLEDGMKEAEDDASEAKNDLQALDAQTTGLKTDLDGIKEQIKTTSGEIDSLTQQLKQMREKNAQAKLKSAKSLQQIDEVVAKASLRQRDARRHRAAIPTDSEISGELSNLQALGSELSVSEPNFLQTGKTMSKPKVGEDNLAVLQEDKQDLARAKDASWRGFDEEEARTIELIKTKQDELQTLEDNLKEQIPVLADKMKQGAETNRTLSSALRGLERDKSILKTWKDKCTLMKDNTDENIKGRSKLITLLKMTVAIVAKMDTVAFLEGDMRDLRGSSASFVQLRSRARREESQESAEEEDDSEQTDVQEPQEATEAGSAAMVQEGFAGSSSSTGPFDKVKDMIQALIANLKDQANQNMDRHQFCLENAGKIRRQKIQAKRSIEQFNSQIRRETSAITRLNEQITFFDEEIARLKKSDAEIQAEYDSERSRMDGERSDLAEDKDVIEKVITVLDELCELDGTSLLQSKRETNRARQQGPAVGAGKQAQCKEASKLLKEADTQLIETTSQFKTYSDSFGSLVKSIKADSTNAAAERANDKVVGNEALAKRKEALAFAKEDLKTAENDLRLVTESAEQLEQNCGPHVETREERMARRKDEIDALKNALSVLEGEAIPVPN